MYISFLFGVALQPGEVRRGEGQGVVGAEQREDTGRVSVAEDGREKNAKIAGSDGIIKRVGGY
jgi:hypothetical protein